MSSHDTPSVKSKKTMSADEQARTSEPSAEKVEKGVEKKAAKKESTAAQQEPSAQDMRERLTNVYQERRKLFHLLGQFDEMSIQSQIDTIQEDRKRANYFLKNAQDELDAYQKLNFFRKLFSKKPDPSVQIDLEINQKHLEEYNESIARLKQRMEDIETPSNVDKKVALSNSFRDLDWEINDLEKKLGIPRNKSPRDLVI